MTVYKFPRKHAEDWFGRCDEEGWIKECVEVTARTITLDLNEPALADLISDTEYYAVEMGPENTGDIDYRPAARTLLSNLRKQGLV